ncbi:MAG TPA: hypothetical protein G4O15_06350 [Dehalococcoidia bacterium]|nr:hypothetical protein [Dehalococcoidia bacterium]
MEEQILFSDREEFRKWLIIHHDTSPGIWLVLGKSGNPKTVKADEALEEALCFGWIDGLIKSIDDTRYIKKFSRRRKGSKWSVKNREAAEKLVNNGKIAEPGLAAIEEAKKSGNWDLPERETATDDQVKVLIDAINGTEPAHSNFLNMPLSVRRTYTMFYLDAKKEETKIRRLEKIIGRLNENKGPM